MFRFSAHHIKTTDKFGFLPQEYSRFKHGAINIARKFGYEMADKFIANVLRKHYDGRPILVLPSAWSHIPTASYFLCGYFTDKLNAYLFECNRTVAEAGKICRSVSYRDDYGMMSAEQRYNLIKNDVFYMDKNAADGKILLFVDDVKVTGTHERIIVNMLDRYSITGDCYTLYYAEVANPHLPPNVENELNYAYVKSLDEIAHIIKHDEFRFNTRVVKYILDADDQCFDRFIAAQSRNFIEDLYYNAVGNEYFKFNAYKRNMHKLKIKLYDTMRQL
ncbi:MAG: phosphoribosyltransferase family protein [Prevotellaceae bacterium]|jgi:hypothetical protein|nr:phosphoribosyltransferase family protein [Prevotellaceae bacterium]